MNTSSRANGSPHLPAPQASALRWQGSPSTKPGAKTRENYRRFDRAEPAWTHRPQSAKWQLIHCLGRAAEFRDSDTGMHIVRVGRVAKVIAEELGLSASFCDSIERAALLHDLGKMAVPDSIMHKPSRLTAEEYELVKRHCEWGAKMIQPLTIQSGEASPMLAMAARIALTHHEKWDGSGYPRRLQGVQIPIEGRITAVADVFDALANARSYKQAMSVEQCCERMEEARGQHFDPQVLDAFLNRIDDVRSIQRECQD